MILEDTISQALSLAYTHHTLLVSTTALIEILEDTSLRREDEKIRVQWFLEKDNKTGVLTYLKAFLFLGPETKVEKDSSFCNMCLVTCQINNHDIMHDIVMLSGV